MDLRGVFYNKRFAKRRSTLDAVRTTQREMLRRLHGTVHPFYWAAFVAAGDAR